MKKKINNQKIVSFEEQYGAGGPVLDYIRTPQSVILENKLNLEKAKAMGQQDPLAVTLDIAGPIITSAAQMFAGSAAGQEYFGGGGTQQAAMGESVGPEKRRINVEAGEILETAKGDILKISKEAGTHEKGGLDLELENDGQYNMYSNRILSDVPKKGGGYKTISEAKADNEKKIAKYQAHLKKYPGDVAAANTLSRLQKSSKKWDVNMLNLQSNIKQAYQEGAVNTQVPVEGQGNQAAMGFSSSGSGDDELMLRLGYTKDANGNWVKPGMPTLNSKGLPVNDRDVMGKTPSPSTNTSTEIGKGGEIEEVILTAKKDPTNSTYQIPRTNTSFSETDLGLNPLGLTSSKGEEKNKFGRFTAGDLLGTLGMVYQGLAARKGALNNMNTLQLEDNLLGRYGQEQVAATQANQVLINTIRDENLKEIQRNKSAAMNSGTEMSGSIVDLMNNISRAQTIADRSTTDVNTQALESTLKNNQEAVNLLAGIEERYLAEEKRVNSANEEAIDNARGAIDASNVEMGRLLSQIGTVANAGLTREITARSVGMNSVNFDVDSSGNITGRKNQNTPVEQKTPEEIQAEVDKRVKEEQAKKDQAAATTVDASGQATVSEPAKPTGTFLTGDIKADRANIPKTFNPDGSQQSELTSMLTTAGIPLDLTNKESINNLQKILIDSGYLKRSSPTGYFGTETYAALKKFIGNEENLKKDPATGISYKVTPKK